MTCPTPGKPDRRAWACGQSPYCLGVGWIRSGNPIASTAACSLVVKPPRERPMQAASAPLLRQSRRHEPSRSCCRSGHIRSPACRQDMEKPLPYAIAGPAAEAGMNRSPFAEHLRQVAPVRRVSCHPQDRIYEQPVVHAAPTRRPNPSGKVSLNPFPLPVCQRSSAHGLSPSTNLESELRRKGNLLNADRP